MIWSGTPQNLKSLMLIRHEDTNELYAKFLLRQETKELFAKFDVGQGTENLYAKFEAQVSLNLYAKFEAQATKNLYAKFETYPAADLYAKFEAQATKDLYAKFEAQVSLNLFAKTVIRHSGTAQLKATMVIRHPDLNDLYAEFRVSVEPWVMQGLTAETYRALGVLS